MRSSSQLSGFRGMRALSQQDWRYQRRWSRSLQRRHSLARRRPEQTRPVQPRLVAQLSIESAELDSSRFAPYFDRHLEQQSAQRAAQSPAQSWRSQKPGRYLTYRLRRFEWSRRRKAGRVQRSPCAWRATPEAISSSNDSRKDSGVTNESAGSWKERRSAGVGSPASTATGFREEFSVATGKRGAARWLSTVDRSAGVHSLSR